MISNNRSSALVINDHLPIEEASQEYISDRRKLYKNGGNHLASDVMIIFFIWGVTYLLKIYKTDGWDWSAVATVATHLRRVTVKWETNKACFLNKNMKMASKSIKNMLRQS
jgi:hypothetical protein